MRWRTKGLTRRQFLEVGSGTAFILHGGPLGSGLLWASDSAVRQNHGLKIWPDKQDQTIGFELPELPGEVFKIVIPELISDEEEPIIPWETASPNWEIGESAARWSTERPNIVRMVASVHFRGKQIETRVRITNLSQRTWKQVNFFTCFAYYSAPSFDDPQLTRTYFPVEGNWKSVAELFAEHNPGSGPYTFFPVAGGPRLEDFWLCRRIPQRHPQVISKGRGCVVSSDRNWIAGMTTEAAAFVFNNRRERCIHADPFVKSIAPGSTAEGTSTIYIVRGTVADFTKLCDEKAAQVARR